MEALVNCSQPHFKGSIVKEYLLVVNPEDAVSQQVIKEKTIFTGKYSQAIISQAPQIMVASFLAKEELEETLLRWMHKVISSHKSFMLALNNYSGFPNNNTVHLRVQDHRPFKQLSTGLKVVDELVTANGLPRVQFVANPHLAIAKLNDAARYEKAVLDYAHKEFYATFLVKELVLLKRTHQFDACRQVNVFRLLP